MWAIYKKAMRDSQRTMLWLSIGLGLYALLMVSFYPMMQAQEDSYKEMLKSYPKEMMSVFMGGDFDPDTYSLTDIGTFVQTYFMLYGIVIIGALAVVQAFNAITNAERDGTLDVMMSLPVSRRQMFTGRALATISMILIVLTFSIAGFWAGSLIWTEFDINLIELAVGLYGSFFLLTVFTGLSYLLAAVVPSSKHYAGAVAYLALIGTYLIYSLSGLSDALDAIKPLMAYDYYSAGTAINDGAQWGDWAVLAVVSVLFFGLAWWFIDRKELAV
ncbi:MAG TPA: ABC transporter permease subunit [Aggregatilineaceae bacterium]|nr:ABC transporter permease subunit [Aggregatilineaceae bacterium]